MTYPGEYTDRASLGTIAVVGAGMAGVTAARLLHEQGFSVQLFEKSRGPGGRMATRREGEFVFDHGAQHFTARDDLFQRYVNVWQERGVASLWRPRLAILEDNAVKPLEDRERRYVGVPGMNSLVKAHAMDLPVASESRVTSLVRDGKNWVLGLAGGQTRGPFFAVILAIPAEQAVTLLDVQPSLQQRAAMARMHPCIASLVVFEVDLELNFDAAFVHDSPLVWVARNASKPGRADGECWVLHASPAWSRAHSADAPDDAAIELLKTFKQHAGVSDATCLFSRGHRWLYSAPDRPLTEGCLWDADLHIGACGDWCHSARVEGAFLSGWKLAERMVASFEADRLIERRAQS